MTRYIVVDSHGRTVLSDGDLEAVVWMHSTAKPLQLLPLLDRDMDRKFALSAGELALLASSHLAQPQHVGALRSILEKTGLQEEQLILPPSAPSGRISFRNWQRRQGKKRKLYHPCAGNHLAIMLLQRELTGSTAGYERLSSPAQQEILPYIQAYTGETPKLKPDHCGIPTYGVSLGGIAAAYQRLGGQTLSGGAARFLRALHAAPVMVEGDGCISTVLCSDNGLIAKTGVNHLLALGSRREALGAAIVSSEGWTDVLQVLCGISAEVHLFGKELERQLSELIFADV